MFLGLEQWKQELREKMLNFTGDLSVNQRKDMEKRLSELSEEEIQQLLNDDHRFRDMAGSILNTEQPQPADIALLLALAEQHLNESGTSESGSTESGNTEFGNVKIDNSESGDEDIDGIVQTDGITDVEINDEEVADFNDDELPELATIKIRC